MQGNIVNAKYEKENITDFNLPIGINPDTSEEIKLAARLVWLGEEVARLKDENTFLSDAYEAMRAVYMPLLIENNKLAKRLKRVKRLFCWLVRKYRSLRKGVRG